MNQLYPRMDGKVHSKDTADNKKYRTKNFKLNNYVPNNRLFSNRVACRVNRGKNSGKWRTAQTTTFDNYKSAKAQKSLTPTVNKISKWANYNPFLSPDQQSKSSGVRRVNTTKVNTFLQRMDMFGNLDRKNKNSPLRKHKLQRDDLSYRKKEHKRSINKSKLLAKSKGTKGGSGSPGSLKRMRKGRNENAIASILDKKKYQKRGSKKSLGKNKGETSSLMFSKFLRSMEMADSPMTTQHHAKAKNETYSLEKKRSETRRNISSRWLVQPNLLGMILNSGAMLIQVLDCLQNNKDIYDYVKDYVEISQSSLYAKLEDTVHSGSPEMRDFGENICTVLKMERWVILFFFFFSFNKSKKTRVTSVLDFLAKKLCENFYSLMISLRASGVQGFDLEEVKKEIDDLMRKSGFNLRNLNEFKKKIVKKNVNEIRDILKICASYADKNVQEELLKSLSKMRQQRICSVTEHCLETFFPFLSEKKVISVEMVDNAVSSNVKKSAIQKELQRKSKSIKAVKSKRLSWLRKDSNGLATKTEDTGGRKQKNSVRSKDQQRLFSSKKKSSKRHDSEVALHKAQTAERNFSGASSAGAAKKSMLLKAAVSKKGRKKKKSRTELPGEDYSTAKTEKFRELIRKLETEDNNLDNQLFFFQPELDNDEPQPPFLPKKTSEHKFTLVLDLDETLVHFQETEDSGQFLVRPFAQSFLAEMGKYFEVVIFTAALQEYADWILERIDETKILSYRLYRQHTRPTNSVFIKDLSLLGRDLKRTIIIDNNAENFQKQPENGIFIKSWYGDTDDQALLKLTPILKQISIDGYDDIRVALRLLKEAMVRGIKRANSPLVMNTSPLDRHEEDKENIMMN